MNEQPAVRCACDSQATKVIDSRATEKHGAHVRRRVECLHCGRRWTTFEIDEAVVMALQAPRVKTLIGHVKRFLTLIESHALDIEATALEEESKWTSPPSR